MLLRRIFVFLIATIAITQTLAQQKNIDKLELSLQNLSPYQKAKIYNQLAQYYKNISLEKSYKNSKLALKYGEKYNNIEQILQAKLNIGEYFLDNGNYERAKKYFFDVLKNKKYENNAIKAATLNKIGVVNYFQSKDSIAMYYLKKSLNIYNKTAKKYLQEKGQILNLISYIHNREGNYSEALDFHFQALKVREEFGDKNEIAKSYNSIGLFYVNQGDYKSSMSYYKKSLKISKEIGNKKGEAISLNNIATIYVKQGLCEKAEKLHQKALKIKKELNIKKEIALSYKNIGKLHVCKNDYKGALSNFSIACDINKNLGNYVEVADIHLLIAKTSFEQKDYQKALTHYQKAETFAIRSNASIILNTAYEGLFQTYLILENAKLFMKYYKKSQELKDKNHIQSINSAEIQVMQKKYEQAEKIRESEILIHKNEVLEKEKKLRLLNIRQKNIYLTFLIVGLVALLIITLLIYFQFRMRQKSNETLRKINNKFIQLNHRLLESENKLEKSNQFKTKLLSMVSHDVRNPITSLNALMQLLATDIDSLNKKELKKIVKGLNLRTANVLDFLDDLLNWTSNQSQNLQLKPEVFNVCKLTKKVYNIVLPQLENKSLSFNSEVESSLMIFTDQNILKTVLLNLVSNAIKFTPEQGMIEIKVEKIEEQIQFMVADTGRGITKKSLEKIFNPDIHFTTVGTKQEKGTGLGLQLCKEFVELLGGTIWVESEVDKGSKFFFTVLESKKN